MVSDTTVTRGLQMVEYKHTSLFHVYIGGPMNGYPNFNYDTFYEVETELNLHGLPGVPGIVVVNPARNFEGDQTRPRREYLALAVTQILDCQAMVLLPGWQDSPGTQLEVQLAYNNGLSFYCAVKAPGDPCYTVHPVSAMSVKSVLDVSESLDPMPCANECDCPPAEALGDNGQVTMFAGGAYRDTSERKLDFEGFLSPRALEAFAEYMHSKRETPIGYRDSDNWQKGDGFTYDSFMKSGWRHFFDWWKLHRGVPCDVDKKTALCALAFNVMGYLDKLVKEEEAS